MIIFKYLRFKNILSYGNTMTELVLNANTTTLIMGDNGAGKSTFIDALVFCLYGKPFRKINKGGLLNSINKKALVTEVEFDIGDDEYKVVRGIKPNIFEVYKNGEIQMQEAGAGEQQANLEKNILKLNFKSFSQIIILGSASYIPFMELTTPMRREIVEDILDLKVFSTMNILVKADIQAAERNITALKSEIVLLTEKIKIKQEHNNSLLKDSNAEIEIREAKIRELDESIVQKQDNLEIINEKINAITNPGAANAAKSSYDRLIGLKGKIEGKNDRFREELNFFKNTEICPTCSQTIDETHKKSIIECKTVESKKMSDGLDKIVKEIEKEHNKLILIQQVDAEINKLTTNAAVLFQTIRADQSAIENQKHEIVRLKAKQGQMLDDSIKLLDAELLEKTALLKNETENYDIYIQSLPFLKDDGIKAAIIDQYVPKINVLINQYLSQLGFFVQFELDKEFNETIKSRFRDEFTYGNFSEGEKLRIDLSLLFTWRQIAKSRNSISTNLLILDEVLDSSLDYSGNEEFIRILKDLTTDNNSFIISHKADQLLEKFENVILFEKVENFSRKAA